jgi:hypothetical protein
MLVELKRLKAILFHPLSQGFGVSSLSLGVLLWLPGFDPTPANANDPLQVLVDRCADLPNRQIVIDHAQYRAVALLPPGAGDLVIQTIGDESFCRLSNRNFMGTVATPYAFPLANSNTVLLVIYDQNGVFVGIESWELPATPTTHQVFAQNWSDRYGQVNPAPKFFSNGGNRPILSALADFFFGPDPQSKAAPAPSYVPPVQYQSSNPSACQ